MLEDTEQEDSVPIPVADRSKSEIQQKQLVPCYKLSDDNIVEKLQPSRTLSVQCDVSSTSVSNEAGGSTILVASQSQYTCAACLQLFSTRDLLISHVFSHDLYINSPLHICKNCGLIFLNLSKLYAHCFQWNRKVIFKEPPLVELACACCTDTFSSWSSLRKHVFIHISGVSTPLYICTYCSEVFKDVAKLQLHEYISRTSQRRGYGDCKNFNYANEQKLSTSEFQTNRIRKELATIHSYSSSFENKQSYLISIPDKLSSVCELHETSCVWSNRDKNNHKSCRKYNQRIHMSERTFCCEVCGILFTKALKLDRHRQIHLHELPLISKVSANSFKGSSSLGHQRIHVGERRFPCDVCKKTFTQAWALKRHHRSHSGKCPFSCEVCGKSFKQSGSLKRHLRIHLGERRFSCDVCGKSFTESGSVKSHKRIHFGERPYSCEVCGKSFTRSDILKSHQRIHLGERPYSCDVCGKSFTQSGSIKKHKRIHLSERPFSCEVCAKSFTESGNLRSHQRIHFSERPFHCEVCGKSFTRSDNLKSHQRIHFG